MRAKIIFDLVPFTALIVKDNLFLETHPGENAEECFTAAEASAAYSSAAHPQPQDSPAA